MLLLLLLVFFFSQVRLLKGLSETLRFSFLLCPIFSFFSYFILIFSTIDFIPCSSPYAL